jgi:hypothetical protein
LNVLLPNFLWLLQILRPGVGFLPRPLPSWRRSGDLARRSGERLLFGEAERVDTAESDSDTAEIDAEFLASQRISACVDIAVAVS